MKVYWSTGGQVVPPHDKAIVERVMNVTEIKRVDFPAGRHGSGKIVLCKDEIDAAFIENVVAQGLAGPAQSENPLFAAARRRRIRRRAGALGRRLSRHRNLRPAQRQPDGDFPNVPGHVSNPENPAVFDMPH